MPVVYCDCGLKMGIIADANLRKGWVITCSGCQLKQKRLQEDNGKLLEKIRLLTLSSELDRKKKDDIFGDLFGDIFKKGPFG